MIILISNTRTESELHKQGMIPLLGELSSRNTLQRAAVASKTDSGNTAAISAAGSGSTTARARDDDDDSFVNAAAIPPWDVAPAVAACSAAGSGSTTARAIDVDDDCFVNAAAISPWDVARACSMFSRRLWQHRGTSHR